MLNPKTIEMEKREKVHHLVFNVLLVPRVTQRTPPHTPPHTARERHGHTTPPRSWQGHGRANGRANGHGTPPTTNEDGAHGLCDGAVASWCGEHGERVVDDLARFVGMLLSVENI